MTDTNFDVVINVTANPTTDQTTTPANMTQDQVDQQVAEWNAQIKDGYNSNDVLDRMVADREAVTKQKLQEQYGRAIGALSKHKYGVFSSSQLRELVTDLYGLIDLVPDDQNVPQALRDAYQAACTAEEYLRDCQGALTAFITNNPHATK